MASRISSKTPRRDPSIRTSKGRLIGFFPLPERVELSIEHLLATPKPRKQRHPQPANPSLAIRRSQAENVQPSPRSCVGAYLPTHRDSVPKSGELTVVTQLVLRAKGSYFVAF